MLCRELGVPGADGHTSTTELSSVPLLLLSRKSLLTGSSLMVLVLFLISGGPLLGPKPPKLLPAKPRLQDGYTLESPSVCLPWLVGTGVAFCPSPWPSASLWPSLSAFVKAINRAGQA